MLTKVTFSSVKMNISLDIFIIIAKVMLIFLSFILLKLCQVFRHMQAGTDFNFLLGLTG